MTKQQQLTKLLKAESILKKTKVGYEESGPNWKTGMPMLWAVRLSLGNTPDGLLLAEAHGILKETERGYHPNAPRWQAAMKRIDAVEEKLHPAPVFGPAVKGDKSLGLWVPTHNTDGLFGNPKRGCHDGRSQYPAFDSAFGRDGAVVLAPEPLEVTCQSSASGADAFYAVGQSGLAHWVGHIVNAPPTGREFGRGDQVGTVARISAANGGPHLHWGIDARKLIGRDLLYGGQRKPSDRPRDYTFGSPTIGQQLASVLAA